MMIYRLATKGRKVEISFIFRPAISEVSNNPGHPDVASRASNRAAGDLEHTRVGFGSRAAPFFGVTDPCFINARI